MPTVGLGGACSVTSDCTGAPTLQCDAGKCAASLGVQCDNTAQCIRGLSCTTSSLNNGQKRCHNSGLLNSACIPIDAPCADGFTCVGAASNSTGKCKALTGGACTINDDCTLTGEVGVASCKNNTCTATSGVLNDECSSTDDCVPNYVCDYRNFDDVMGKCKLGFDMVCQRGDDCFKGKCNPQEECCASVDPLHPDIKRCIQTQGGSSYLDRCSDNIPCNSMYINPEGKAVPLTCISNKCVEPPSLITDINFQTYFYVVIGISVILFVTVIALSGYIVYLKKFKKD